MYEIREYLGLVRSYYMEGLRIVLIVKALVDFTEIFNDN